ncbi:hypothetical protein FS837_005809, partial [Tulasnella sp. UAMH 9824]
MVGPPRSRSRRVTEPCEINKIGFQLRPSSPQSILKSPFTTVFSVHNGTPPLDLANALNLKTKHTKKVGITGKYGT